MHGPEHWLGLVRATVIVGVVLYVLWRLLDGLRGVATHAWRRLTDWR